MKPPRYWQTLHLSTTFGPHPEESIRLTMKVYGETREAAVKRLDDYDAGCEYWINSLYQVQRRVSENEPNAVHLNVRRRDGAPIHDWRHLQQIKNELLGVECEAVELYPADSRMVDTTNKYHLWGSTDPTFRFPFGFKVRDVMEPDDTKSPGLRQRSF